MATKGAEFDAKKNLIVNFLPASYTQDDFQKIFAKIGDISSCKLMQNKDTGESLSYGFVCFADEKSAAIAIKEVDGTVIGDKTLKVKYAKTSNDDENTNVYVAGLPSSVTEEKLLSLFQPFGEVLSHKVLTDTEGNSRGAAMVRFAQLSAANAAIKDMNQKVLPEAKGPLTVKLALPPATKRDSALPGTGGFQGLGTMRYNPMMGVPQTHTPKTAVALAFAELGVYNLDAKALMASVYVFGLPESASDLTLFELFSPFGAILSVKLVKDLEKEEQPCKGYGFVNYVSSSDAMRAVKAMNGVTFEDRTLQVSLKQNTRK